MEIDATRGVPNPARGRLQYHIIHTGIETICHAVDSKQRNKSM